MVRHGKQEGVAGRVWHLNKEFPIPRHLLPQRFQKSARIRYVFQGMNQQDPIHLFLDLVQLLKDPGNRPGSTDRPDAGWAFFDGEELSLRGLFSDFF